MAFMEIKASSRVVVLVAGQDFALSLLENIWTMAKLNLLQVKKSVLGRYYQAGTRINRLIYQSIFGIKESTRLVWPQAIPTSYQYLPTTMDMS
jgi:hypothetical protein